MTLTKSNDKMKKKRILLLVVIFCVLVRLLISFPLNNSYPGGTDISIHLLRIWLMEKNGMIKWNYYSGGGRPLLNIYSPLGYVLASFLAQYFGFLIGYKIVMNTVFLISTILFFIFLKEFGLDDKQIIVALLFFSLLPIHSYYFADGRYGSLVGFIFCLMYWLYLKKYFDKNRISNFIISAIFLSFTIITNHTVAFMIVIITFIWSILYQNYRKILKNIFKFILIVLLSFLLSSWWLMPYVINRLGIEEKGSDVSDLPLKNTMITNYIDEIVFRVMNLGVYQSKYVVTTTIMYVIITVIVCLLALFKIKNKTNRDFIIISFLIIVLSIILKFKRVFILLPISLSVVVSYGISKLRKNFRIIFSITLFIPIIISFFLIRPNFIQNAYFPKLPNDGRFVYFGNESSHYGSGIAHNYFHLLSAIQENENMQGFYLGAAKSSSLSMFFSDNRIQYGKLLLRYGNMSQNEYYEVLDEGWVNYIVLDENSELNDYFNESNKFNFKYHDNGYSIFETVPKSTYVEINNKNVLADVTKSNDGITISMKCEPGDVTIKETYDKNWGAELNGENIELKENDYGFMTFENNLDEKCMLNLKFGLSKLDIVFLFISVTMYFFTSICLIHTTIKK